MFWVLKFFGGVPPKILDRHYEIGHSIDHRAKFHASRPTHLGDLALEKNKLEILGKAQSESAQRPKSDCGEIRSGGTISLAPKSCGPNSNALAYAERALST